MKPSVIREKQVLMEVLEKYKELSLLWDNSHEFYASQAKRKEAYNHLLKIYQRCEPDMMLHDLKKKIENMRTSYKREHTKVIKASCCGEEYVPTLWYYNFLTFLDDRMDKKSQGTPIKTQTKSDDDEEEDEIDALGDYNDSNMETYNDSPPKKKSKKADNVIYLPDDIDDANLKTDTCTINEEQCCDPNESSAVSFGKTVGLQLQELQPLQRFIAEKLISEVIFYSRLEKLQPNSTLNVNNNDGKD